MFIPDLAPLLKERVPIMLGFPLGGDGRTDLVAGREGGGNWFLPRARTEKATSGYVKEGRSVSSPTQHRAYRK